MKCPVKRMGVAVVAATSLAVTGALVGHATPDDAETVDEGGAAVTAEGAQPVDATVMLATEHFEPGTLTGDFDGDGVADRAILTTELHHDRERPEATCWVDFELSSAESGARQAVRSWAHSWDAFRRGACLGYTVTDFNGDGKQGITVFRHGYWLRSGFSDMVPGEVTVDGIQPLSGLPDAIEENFLHFGDVTGDQKTDVVASIPGHPDFGATFDVMITPDDGNPSVDAPTVTSDGIFATIGDVDPARPGGEVIYRGAPEDVEDGDEGDDANKWCTVNVMYAPSGDRRAIIGQESENICPASDIEVGTHNGQPALAVGWADITERSWRTWKKGQYSTIHQADANGTFHKVTDYPAPVAQRDRVKLTTGSHRSGCIPVMGNDLNTLGARIRITGGPSLGVAEVNTRSTPCIDYTWQHSAGGTDELEYVLEGPGGTSEPQRVIIESVGDMPPAPVAYDDSFSQDPAQGGSTTCHPVQANDENAAFSTVEVATKPDDGIVEVLELPDGSSCVFLNRYNLNTEPATFTYTLTHMGRESEPATVTITMNDGLPAPEAADDMIDWPYTESVPEAHDLLANDTNVAGARVTITRQPEHGTVKTVGDRPGIYEYLPNAVAVESDSFEYEVMTGGGTSRATVSVSRSGEMPALPVAVDDHVELEPSIYWPRRDRLETRLDVLGNDQVTALGAVNIVSQPSLGEVEVFDDRVFYSLPEGPTSETRETSFTYTLTNVVGVSEEATVTIVLLP